MRILLHSQNCTVIVSLLKLFGSIFKHDRERFLKYFLAIWEKYRHYENMILCIDNADIKYFLIKKKNMALIKYKNHQNDQPYSLISEIVPFVINVVIDIQPHLYRM